MTGHRSEHQVGRIKYCKSCGRPHLFPRYQAGPRELPAEEWGPLKTTVVATVGLAFVWSLVTLLTSIGAPV